MAAGSGMVKYGFRIRTRSGMVLDNLTIHGRDEADAERKLRQMYLHCQILECRTLGGSRNADPVSSEEIGSLVTK